MHALLRLLERGIGGCELTRSKVRGLTHRVRRNNVDGALLQDGDPAEQARHERRARVRGRCGVDAERLAKARELDDVRRDDRAPVAADDGRVLADHEEAVRVKHDEHAALARDGHRHLSEGLHVRLAAEPGADDEDVQPREDGLQLGADFLRWAVRSYARKSVGGVDCVGARRTRYR